MRGLLPSSRIGESATLNLNNPGIQTSGDTSPFSWREDFYEQRIATHEIEDWPAPHRSYAASRERGAGRQPHQR